MVANEGSGEANDLVMVFKRTSQYVDDTKSRLVEAGKALALAWSGAPASDLAQKLLTELTDAMGKDATAYTTATSEVGNIVDRLTETKRRVEPLFQQWMRLYNLPANTGIYSQVVVESDVYQSEIQQTNESAREEMRRLDRDLTGARITTTDDFVPSTGVPATDDLQLAGLGPQAIEAARGGGLGRGLLSGGGHGLPPTASVVPGGIGGLGAAGAITGPVRPAMGGVIGADAASSNRPAGGMMGGGAGGGGHGGAGGGAGGGKANTQWEAAQGVTPVIDGTPPPKPSTMGVDDSFDQQQKRN